MKAIKVSLLALSVGIAPTGALAQDAQDGAAIANDNVITVTARKKSESDLNVPIAIRAYGAEQLERKGIQSLYDVAATTPSLNVSAAASDSGGTISLRGIGTPTAGAGPDQAVALNLDGTTLSDGVAVRLGQFDMAQIEILQGPQSLYYGKNSSGGIISITSADPTDSPYAMLRAGYGFEAREMLTEAVISGPITDTLGARLAVYRSDMKGYFKNPLSARYEQGVPNATQLAIFGPVPRAAYARAPDNEVTAIRATLKFDPTDALSIRLKGNWLRQRGSDSFSAGQKFNCPAGVPAPASLANVAGIEDCEINHFSTAVGSNTDAITGGAAAYGDGTPYAKLDLILLSGTIDYELSDGFLLSSNTSYYRTNLREGDVQTHSPYPLLGSTIRNVRNDFQQELRISSDLDSPLNGMAGVYFQDGKYNAHPNAHLALPGFGALPTPFYYIDSRTAAVFGQLTLDLLDDKFQVSAGGRYSDEKRTLEVDLLGAAIEDVFATKRVDSSRFSPEVTLSYRPNQLTNVFATYKKGAKSGGFAIVSVLPFPVPNGYDLSFRDEIAEGFEGGIKTVIFDNQLRFDLTGYHYNYDDFQVTVFDPTTSTTGVRNAAAVRTYGIQLNTNFAPNSVPGLNIGASVNYGHARYRRYLADCYTGQTQADGCVFRLTEPTIVDPVADPTERAFRQDLSGRPLSAAPDWTGNINANYDFDVTSGGTRLGLSASATYQDGYEVLYNQAPGSRQSSSVNVDATIRLFNDDDGWELALIGKNLTDQLRARWAAEVFSAPGLGIDTLTGASSGVGIQSDNLGFTNAPRTFMLRLTFKPFGNQ